MTIILETARLIARRLDERHLDALTALFADSRVNEDYAASGLTPPTATDALARARERYARGHGHCALERRDDGAFVGITGLLWQDVEGARELEVGYRLAHAHWNQGYASEAATAFCDFAFRTTDVPRVIALIHPDNARSIAVAERCGLRFTKMVSWHRVPCPVRLHALRRE